MCLRAKLHQEDPGSAYLFERLIADMLSRKPDPGSHCCCPGSIRGQAISGKYVAKIYSFSAGYVTTVADA